MTFVIYPVFALRDIRPCADKSQPFRQCINITIGAVDPFYRARHPIIGHAAALVQKPIDGLQQTGMFGLADPAEIRHAADIPQQPHRRHAAGARAHLVDLHQRFQRKQIVAIAGAHQQIVFRLHL